MLTAVAVATGTIVDNPAAKVTVTGLEALRTSGAQWSGRRLLCVEGGKGNAISLVVRERLRYFCPKFLSMGLGP